MVVSSNDATADATDLPTEFFNPSATVMLHAGLFTPLSQFGNPGNNVPLY